MEFISFIGFIALVVLVLYLVSKIGEKVKKQMWGQPTKPEPTEGDEIPTSNKFEGR